MIFIHWGPTSLILLAIAGPSLAAVLSSSKLQACVNDGSEELECDKKVVLAITLEQGQGATEHAEFMVNEVSDESDNTRQLLKPWRVSWTKTPAFWRYPLRYVQDVNAEPQEKRIRVGSNSCRDNPQSPAHELTCGVAELAGQRIENSEGFCCGCDLNDVTSGLATRGDLSCGVFDMQESAHCLWFGDLWYSVFEVDRPQVFYDIIVTLSIPEDPAANWTDVKYVEHKLVLSHLQPTAMSPGGELRTELVGDLATATAPHRFDSRYLVVPNRPSDNPRVNLEKPLSDAMLIDKSLFDLTGRTCDAIGVSYTAFKRQSDKCERAAGSCLSGQLEDLHQEDLERESKNHQTSHFVRGFCAGAVELGTHQSGAGGKTRFLACPLEQRHTTLMRLEVKAEDAMFVTNVASGRIVSATVEGFEALQGGGKVNAVVLSTGSVTAEFTFGMTNCTLGFEPGPALRFTLSPYATGEQGIDLHASQTKGGTASCQASLYDSLGKVLEVVSVYFNVTDMQETSGAQVPVDRPDSKFVDEAGGSGGDDCPLCSGMFDAMCFVMMGCWKRIGIMLFIIAAICLALYCIVWGTLKGMPCKLMRCCCAPLCSGSSGSSGSSAGGGGQPQIINIQQGPGGRPRLSHVQNKRASQGPSGGARASQGAFQMQPPAQFGMPGWPQKNPGAPWPTGGNAMTGSGVPPLSQNYGGVAPGMPMRYYGQGVPGVDPRLGFAPSPPTVPGGGAGFQYAPQQGAPGGGQFRQAMQQGIPGGSPVFRQVPQQGGPTGARV